MTAEEIKQSIKDIIAEIQPDADLDALAEDVSLRDQLDLDSMDVLDMILSLRKLYKLPIPNEDVEKLATLNSAVEYLEPLLNKAE